MLRNKYVKVEALISAHKFFETGGKKSPSVKVWKTSLLKCYNPSVEGLGRMIYLNPLYRHIVVLTNCYQINHSSEKWLQPRQHR